MEIKENPTNTPNLFLLFIITKNDLIFMNFQLIYKNYYAKSPGSGTSGPRFYIYSAKLICIFYNSKLLPNYFFKIRNKPPHPPHPPNTIFPKPSQNSPIEIKHLPYPISNIQYSIFPIKSFNMPFEICNLT